MYKVMDFIKDHKEEFKIFFAIFGLYLLIISAIGIFEDANKKEIIIDMWEEQLPANHWVKKDILGRFVTFEQNLSNTLSTGYDVTAVTFGQSGKMGSLMETVMNVEKDVWRGEYKLFNANNGKKIRKTIKVKEGESVNLAFYFKDNIQEFDVKADEFAEKGNQWVLSCVEDTSIATIYDGKITAHNKGKTILYLFCDGEFWEYKLKVK